MSEDCPHCVFEKTEANCRGCFEGSHYKPKQITNADRIRSMTDEELAEFLDSIVQDWHQGTAQIGDRIIDSWLDWLKEEAKGESDESSKQV